MQQPVKTALLPKQHKKRRHSRKPMDIQLHVLQPKNHIPNNPKIKLAQNAQKILKKKGKKECLIKY